jgi:hypothetical protein
VGFLGAYPKNNKKYSFQIPAFVQKEVSNEIKLINKHQGFNLSPLFSYREDYSQYVPRGHYNSSEQLKNYFLAMMWHGRMTFLAKGSATIVPNSSQCNKDGIISTADANIQTEQARLITKEFLANKTVQVKWRQIYQVTNLFAGSSDDLNLIDYSNVLKAEPQSLEKFTAAILNLSYNPKIYSGLGNCALGDPFTAEQVAQQLQNTKGLRFFGQRYSIDSYALGKMIAPYVGKYTGDKTPFTLVTTPSGNLRGFPRGLDVMAILGSGQALKVLHQYGDADYQNYATQLAALSKETANIGQFKDVYSQWLYSLQALLIAFDSGYPTFMQQPEWLAKELVTTLTSWTQLRHDTALYVKQAYNLAECGEGEPLPIPEVVGYVEPIPEFYARLLNTTNLMLNQLSAVIPQDQLEKSYIKYALKNFSLTLGNLYQISKKELANQQLTNAEYEYIKSFGAAGGCGDGDTLSSDVYRLLGGDKRTADELLKPTLVTDVYTESNTRQVLEEGSGYLQMLIVAYKLPNGKILIGTGPVFSYYEFKQPMSNRLDDKAWRNMLSNKQLAPKPSAAW